MGFQLPDITCQFAVGLEAATQAIYDAKLEIAEPSTLFKVVEQYTGRNIDFGAFDIAQKNAALASTIREVANERGWLAGWRCLTEACPNCGIHKDLMDDLAIGVEVHENLTGSRKPRTFIPDIEFTIVSSPRIGYLNEVGPKTLGGHAWKENPTYLEAMAKWNVPTGTLLAPVAFFGWIGCAKKVPTFDDPAVAADFWSAQLLGLVDYDFDKAGSNIDDIKKAIHRSALTATKQDGRMRGVAWLGMLTMDQQMYNRSVQERWVAEGKGSFVIGPDDMPPHKFAVAGYVDCAFLGPLAYQSSENLLRSKTGLFMTVMFANLHDILFDLGSSNKMACSTYAAATDAYKYDIPQAFGLGMIDALALETLNGARDQRPAYGDNTMYISYVWELFTGRYRTWERFIKYTRLLRSSCSEVAAGILQRAADNMVLIPATLSIDPGECLTTAIDANNASKLVPRKQGMHYYPVVNPESAFKNAGLALPKLCERCTRSFEEVINNDRDMIEAIPGLPETVTSGDSAAMAAGIRRACIWATTSQSCDKCACVIGFWVNDMSDRIVVALVQSELKLCTRDWLLENYFVSCVAHWPLRLISILAGFDVNVNIKLEKGAMGDRDVVDE